MHLSNNLVLKRVIVFYFFLTFSGAITATDYFFSSGGDDVKNNGLSPSSPWKTISKVNSIFTSLNAGDRILFRCGEMFYGTIKILNSGQSGNPITIGSYGTGGKPVITGFQTLSSWTNAGGGVYSIPVICESVPEIVTIDGKQYAMGRYPNSAVWPGTQKWASIDSYSGVTSITDAELGISGINWSGADLVVRNSTRNRITIYPITNQTGNTLTFSGGNTSCPVDSDYGYFIQNDIRTLDSFGEWYFDPKTSVFYMYFGSESPDNHSVNVATINYLIIFDAGMTYCNIDNLSLYGVNNTAIHGNWNHNTTIKNCDINFCGYYGIYLNKSTYTIISNCIIDHCNDNGMYIVEDCDNALISNNKVTNIGLFPGMGQGLFESCMGILIRGSDNTIVEYNDLINIGYTCFRYSGNDITIRNNYVNNFCFIKEDGGAICYAGQDTYSNMKVLNNIILNGSGSPHGLPPGKSPWISGIYVDYYTSGGIEISGNTIANVFNMGGILISGSQNVIAKDNTVFNCGAGVRIQELTGFGSPPRNVTMKGNIIFAKMPSHTPLLLYSTTNDLDQFGYFDNNYYARPLDNAKPIITGVSGNVNARSLPEWQNLYKQDLNSNISPITLKDTSDIDFYFNVSKSVKTISLTRPMIDVRGQKYFNSVTLEPYSSIILMVDPEPEAPVVPVYKNSVVQDSAPDKIEINYTVALALSAPPSEAFTVKINGVACKVTNVFILDTKIILTLENPVKFGDNVTVSYTQPETNKIQSSKGSLAENISEQAVKNNIPDPAVSNKPPVIVLSYETTSFSGFVYEIDASGTTDPDKDSVSFLWKAPSSIPVAGTKGSKIRFLAPVVKIPENVVFTLTVSDGRVAIDKDIAVTLTPYKPEITMLKIFQTLASSYARSCFPENATDGNPTTRWSAEGDDQWLLVNLPVPCKISHLQVAFLTEQKYESLFDIYASKDNIIWEPVILNVSSCDFSGTWQIFNFPEVTNNNLYSYVKLICHGNSSDNWNNISEFKIFGSINDVDSKSYYNSSAIELYPNPAIHMVKVLIQEPSSQSRSLLIYNSSGVLCMEEVLEPEMNFFQIQIALRPGIYIAKIVQSGLITHTQKLIVVQG